MDPIVSTIWRFVRGDLPAAQFEQWLYHDQAVEECLGPARFLELVSADFRDAGVVMQLKESLRQFARTQSHLRCECVALPDTAVLDMGDPGLATQHFIDIARRGKPYWWLGVSRCTVCQTAWLVAQEERQNDVFILRRLTEAELSDVLDSGCWPADFDSYKTLLRLGREAGHSVRFADPVGDSSLAWTMADVARAEPGIGLTELAELLNLEYETAEVIAGQVVSQHDVQITFDRGP